MVVSDRRGSRSTGGSCRAARAREPGADGALGDARGGNAPLRHALLRHANARRTRGESRRRRDDGAGVAHPRGRDYTLPGWRDHAAAADMDDLEADDRACECQRAARVGGERADRSDTADALSRSGADDAHAARRSDLPHHRGLGHPRRHALRAAGRTMAADAGLTAVVDRLIALFNRQSLDLPDGVFTRHTQFRLNGVPFEEMLGRSPDDPLVLMLARGPAGYRVTAKAVPHAVG